MSSQSREVHQVRGEDPRRWRVLALLGAAQFMLVLDVTVVAIALPQIGADLGLARDTLTWVVSAYTLMFGGLMLLGGRAADLFGAHRLVLAGLTVFTAASLVTGLADSSAMLLGGRIAQGVGAAMLSPAALSLVVVSFQGEERNRALGIWSALGGGGAAIGVLLGGLLTAGPGWPWVFYINVPIGLVSLAVLTRLLPALPAAAGPARRAWSAAGHRRHRNRDLRADQRGRPRLAHGGHPRDPGRGRGVVRHVRALAAHHQGAADGPADPRPPPRRRRHVPDPGGDRLDDRSVLPRLLLPPAPPWLRRAADRAAVSPRGCRDHARRQHRRPGHRPARCPTARPGRARGQPPWAWRCLPCGLVRARCSAASAWPPPASVPPFVVASTTALAQVGQHEAGLASGIVSTFHEFGAALGAAVISSIAGASILGTGGTGFTRGFAAAAVTAAVAGALAAIVVPTAERSAQAVPMQSREP